MDEMEVDISRLFVTKIQAAYDEWLREEVMVGNPSLVAQATLLYCAAVLRHPERSERRIGLYSRYVDTRNEWVDMCNTDDNIKEWKETFEAWYKGHIPTSMSDRLSVATIVYHNALLEYDDTRGIETRSWLTQRIREARDEWLKSMRETGRLEELKQEDTV